MRVRVSGLQTVTQYVYGTSSVTHLYEVHSTSFCSAGRDPDTLAAGLGATAAVGRLDCLRLPVPATDGHGLRGGDRHALGYLADTLTLLGGGDHHGVLFLDLFGVRLLHRVGNNLVLVLRHHHRVGLLDLFGVGHLHSVLDDLVFVLRHHHRVGLLNLLGVGHLNRVVTGLRLPDGLHDGVLDRLGALLGDHHGPAPGLLDLFVHRLHDGAGAGTFFLFALRAHDGAHLFDPGRDHHLLDDGLLLAATFSLAAAHGLTARCCLAALVLVPESERI